MESYRICPFLSLLTFLQSYIKAKIYLIRTFVVRESFRIILVTEFAFNDFASLNGIYSGKVKRTGASTARKSVRLRSVLSRGRTRALR